KPDGHRASRSARTSVEWVVPDYRVRWLGGGGAADPGGGDLGGLRTGTCPPDRHALSALDLRAQHDVDDWPGTGNRLLPPDNHAVSRRACRGVPSPCSRSTDDANRGKIGAGKRRYRIARVRGATGYAVVRDSLHCGGWNGDRSRGAPAV